MEYTINNIRKTIVLALALLVFIMSSCHSDPKIDPKKKDKDKGGSYGALYTKPTIA